MGHARAQRCRDDNLGDGPGHGNGPHFPKVGHGKMHAHAEHQQDDANLFNLLGQVGILYKSRSMRPYDNSRDQIADDGRQLKPNGDVPADEGEPQADGNQLDEWRFAVHRDTLKSEWRGSKGYISPNWSFAASVIMLWFQGGSQTSSTFASSMGSSASSLFCTSCASTGPMPQPGAVRVIFTSALKLFSPAAERWQS